MYLLTNRQVARCVAEYSSCRELTNFFEIVSTQRGDEFTVQARACIGFRRFSLTKTLFEEQVQDVGLHILEDMMRELRFELALYRASFVVPEQR